MAFCRTASVYILTHLLHKDGFHFPDYQLTGFESPTTGHRSFFQQFEAYTHSSSAVLKSWETISNREKSPINFNQLSFSTVRLKHGSPSEIYPVSCLSLASRWNFSYSSFHQLLAFQRASPNASPLFSAYTARHLPRYEYNLHSSNAGFSS